MKTKSVLLLVLVLSFLSFSAHAQETLLSWWNETFSAADLHPGLIHAYEPFQAEKIKKYVVLLKDGVPAEQAPYFISWQDYDYRTALVKDDQIKTRRGKIYTKLQKGDVLAVVGPDHFANKLLVKLITPEIYKPEASEAKKFSRVTVTLGFAFPHSVFKTADQAVVEQKLKQWLAVFSSRVEAEQFSASIKQSAALH